MLGVEVGLDVLESLDVLGSLDVLESLGLMFWLGFVDMCGGPSLVVLRGVEQFLVVVAGRHLLDFGEIAVEG